MELGGIISNISKLNIITERRMVISKNLYYVRKISLKADLHLRNVNFSPLSGANTKPRTVIQLIRKHGTIK